LVDFRDLLLSPQQSVQYGGSGQEPYGNVVYELFGALKQLLYATDANGKYKVNDLLPQLLNGQSGLGSLFSTANPNAARRLMKQRHVQSNDTALTTAGWYYSFPSDLMNVQTKIDVGGLNADFSLRMYDAYLENLESIGQPFSILDNVVNQPYELNNSASIGVSGPLRLGMRVLVGLSGEGKC
jgi:hypothetical protein